MDLRQRLKVLLLYEGLNKKISGIMTKVVRSLKLETSLASLASIARKMAHY